MAKKGEHPAALKLFLVPEWAVLDGRCATCRHAMVRTGKGSLRCDEHDVPITLHSSCAKYAPAPNLLEARAHADGIGAATT